MNDATPSRAVLRPRSGVAMGPELADRHVSASHGFRLREGVELLGSFDGGAAERPTYLVRRTDGKMLQVTELLYRLLEMIDSADDLPRMVAFVDARTTEAVTDAEVVALIRDRLVAGGLVTEPTAGEASEPEEPEKASWRREMRELLRQRKPTLALVLRVPLIPASVTTRIGGAVAPLFHTPVVALVALASLVSAVYVLAVHGLASPVRAVLADPIHLAVVAMIAGAAGFVHEMGHAGACRFGGARPGAVGMGLYVIWPVFYADVTDSYRLPRRARIRVDLGGMYFDLIVANLMVVAYLFTGYEPLLLVVVYQAIDIGSQFSPAFRLDGYWLVSDLVGVADLFPYLRAELARMTGHEVAMAMRDLRPRPRRWIRLWIWTTAVVLLGNLLVLLFLIPVWGPEVIEALVSSWRSLGAWFAGTTTLAAGIEAALEVLILGSTVAGLAVLGGLLAWNLASGLVTAPSRRGRLRLLGAVAVAASVFVAGVITGGNP